MQRASTYWETGNPCAVPICAASNSSCTNSLKPMELMAHMWLQALLAHSPRDLPPAARPRSVSALQASLPERYAGDPEGFCNFMLACELYLSEFPELTDKQWIAMLIQRLTGSAQELAAVVWRSGCTLVMDFTAFTDQFQEVFDHPDQGQSSSQQLLWLCQGCASVVKYAITFRILAADNGWNESALLAHFWDRISADIQLELACRDEGPELLAPTQAGARQQAQLPRFLLTERGCSAACLTRGSGVGTPSSVHGVKYLKSVPSILINFVCLLAYMCLTCLCLCLPL